MAIKHRITTNFAGSNGDTLTGTVEHSATAELNLEIAVPANATAYPIEAAFDATKVVSSYILASGDLTLKTNSATIPDEVIELDAQVPDVAHDFTDDVSGLFAVNAASSAVALSIRLLLNAT